MLDIPTATERIFDRVHRTGEEIKNDLPNWVERFIRAKGWSKVIDPATGKPFEDVGKWLIANYPLGPGMGQGRYSINYDEFISLCEDRPKLKDMLIRFRPKGKRGGDRGNQHTGGKVDNVKDATRKTGNSRLYIEERLQRDHPEIWKEYLDGKLKSARQAGIQAGFVKDTHDPLMRLKANWNKASKKQRKEFLAWIKTV
jgi:hypothetical protein